VTCGFSAAKRLRSTGVNTHLTCRRSCWSIRESHRQPDDAADNHSLYGDKHREALWFENPPVNHKIDQYDDDHQSDDTGLSPPASLSIHPKIKITAKQQTASKNLLVTSVDVKAIALRINQASPKAAD
jgi:hypothetical protein